MKKCCINYGRVYCDVPECCFNYGIIGESLDIGKTISEIRTDIQLSINDVLCTKRIAKLVLEKANDMLEETEIKKSSVNISSFASQRQWKYLGKIFNHTCGRMSCFSLVMLLSCFTILHKPGDTNAEEFIKPYIDFIYDAAHRYIEDRTINENEYEVLQYLIDCYDPIMDYIKDPKNNKIDLPAIPKFFIYCCDDEN